MSDTTAQPSLDQIIALTKRRGFVFQTSEIYGGLANSYDYGPLGAELLKNIRDLWWKRFVHQRADMQGLDTQILLHPKTWIASGHVTSFSDPLVEDLKSHKRYRADHLVEEWLEKQNDQKQISVESLSVEELATLISNYNITSPEGNPVSEPKAFNLLFETEIGAVSGEKERIYLRGETAQGLFTNFRQVLDSTRSKVPFGLANIGKSFRNEVTTGQFVFRTLEFEQAEIEYFFNPNQTPWKELFAQWQDDMFDFVTQTLGISEDNLRWRQHSDAERSFYSKETYDLDYKFPFGWKELWGIAYRTDYDLQQHQEHSGQSMEYRDPFTNEVFIPHVIEPAVGINRLFLMILTDAYWYDEANSRTVLKLAPAVAPYKVAIFPLLKNKPELVHKAHDVFKLLAPKMHTYWDDRGNIGKRYLYQDEIGTPVCVTIDFETLEDNTVTLRDRDTAEQKRVQISELLDVIQN